MRAHISTETCTHTHSNRNILCAHNMHTFTHRDMHTHAKKKIGDMLTDIQQNMHAHLHKTCTHILTDT